MECILLTYEYGVLLWKFLSKHDLQGTTSLSLILNSSLPPLTTSDTGANKGQHLAAMQRTRLAGKEVPLNAHHLPCTMANSI